MSQTPPQDPSVAQPGDHGTAPDPTPLAPQAPPSEPSAASGRGPDPLRPSRTSGFYLAVVGLGVVLVLMIIFIVQNTGKSSVTFLFWEGRAPQAVLLLIAVAAGIFLTATASSLRLLQVRRRVKKERKARR